MKTTCKECGETIAVPKDFRKKNKADPRLEHLKTKHNIEWSKGVYDKHFKSSEEKPTPEKKADLRKS